MVARAQLDLPFDSDELQIAEQGSLIVMIYRGFFVIAVRGAEGHIDSIEGDDECIATVAAGLRRAA